MTIIATDKLTQRIRAWQDFCVWRYGEGTTDPDFLHYWEFEGNVNDSQGSSNGTEIGTPSYVTGVFGQAIAVRDGDEAESNFIFDPADYPSGFAICCYILSEANGSGGFVGDAAASGDKVGITSAFETSASLSYGGVSADVSGVTGGGVFHHAVINVDATGVIRFYFDGDQVTDKFSSGPPNIADNPVPAQEMLFSGTETGAASRVHIDDARVYSRPLTLKEITDFAANTKPVGCQAVLGTTGDRKCYNTITTCQDPDNYSRGRILLKFSMNDQAVVPGYIPSILSIDTAPAQLGPGQGLGLRASGTAVFANHPYGDWGLDKYRAERISGAAQADGVGFNPQDQGEYWNKWRARNSENFFRRELLLDERLGDTLVTRNYVVEKIEGPDAQGQFTIEFMDPVIASEGETAQAPKPNTGAIANVGGISDTATSLDLKPAGIGDDEYGTSGWVAVGREVMAYTRTAGSDTLSLGTRGALGTTAEAHEEDDTVQEVLRLQGRLDQIQRKLLVDFASVDPVFIPEDDWENEALDHNPIQYEAFITEPTPVDKLSEQLMDEATYNIFWDDVDQKIPLLVFKEPDSGAALIDDGWILQDTLEPQEQPEKRRSQVWVNFGLIDPTQRQNDKNNYQVFFRDINTDSQDSDHWGSPKIKKIFARFINVGNLTAAQQAGERWLTRFARPPRRLEFDVPIWRDGQVKPGETRRLSHRSLQRDDGARQITTWQILSVERRRKSIHVVAEEFVLAAPLGDEKKITIATDTEDFNFRTEWESVWGPPRNGDVVVCEILAGVVVGGDSGTISFDVGSWPSGVTRKLINKGRIAGPGGKGGDSTGDRTDGQPGEDGGTGLKTTVSLTVDNDTGTIAAGGGGGGGGATTGDPSGAGGGGAGRIGGPGGTGADFNDVAEDGTLTTGGLGADAFSGGGAGGDGGDPAQAGTAGGNSSFGTGGAGGAAGIAVDGDSLITYTNLGTITGSRIN